MKEFKCHRSKFILSMAGMLALGVMAPHAYCAEKQVEKIISLFDGGGYVNQSQVENIVAGGRNVHPQG
ncbi:hypothetical protein [Xanthomonas hortorum]|uniref:hypothetical protein n=1 Tax=Xanthomonas hortorum TaxID=56454 RepID=UPI00293654E9|nr:hypothetical protein [Xanthomonas hortorum]MDV2453584.1 hypothetical protein [Xanthomonas hortorum NBC5720]